MNKFIQRSLYALLLVFAGTVHAASPIANSESTVIFGKVRFTLLTPELIRLEYSETNTFEDKASLTFINRQLATPPFSKKIQGKRLSISTAKLQLEYTDDGKRFNKDNLSIRLREQDHTDILWNPSRNDDKNLKGTQRTLDQANGWDFANTLENGLISQNGWALIDDSENNLFDGDKDWNWVTPRTSLAIDWYFFGYGHNYKKALYDFTQVAGKIPLPPKYAFGYWWSRYWIYNDNELRELTQQFRDFGIPQDVLIIDMDWHETYDFSANKLEKDSQGELKGWTGYTWNKNLFPEPKRFIEWTNQQHLKTALNLHPASGVPTMEEKYADFAKAYEFNKPGEYIPFNMSEKKWAQAYFDTLLKPMQEWGVDFWWLDWQQYLHDKNLPTLSNTWWLNYTFFTNMEKTGQRPMIFHRWGGLGNHRYPIGFSGDAHTNWETLDYETYFTATAANVGYAYWSHDIGGHISNDKPTEGELYLRWIQFGALSPILRTHSSKISLIERRPWMFPSYFFAMRDAIQFRYTLAPYIYTAAHKTYDDGVALVHPLYYEHPEKPQAYHYQSEYYFGDAMIAAPITTAADGKTGLATKHIWLPPGEWFEYSSGHLLKGDAEITRQYALNEIPLFIKAGSIIAMNPVVKNLQERPDRQVLTVIPGGNKSFITLYDDDETSTAYQQQQFTTRKVTQETLAPKTLRLTIEPVQGYYAGMPSAQAFDIRLPNRTLPHTVTVTADGKPIAGNNIQSEFIPHELASNIRLPVFANHQRIEITLEFAAPLNEQDKQFDGNKGFLQRTATATEKLKYASALTDWGGTLPNDVYRTGNIINQLQYHPEDSLSYMQQLNELKKNMADILLKIPNIPQETTKPIVEFLELSTANH